MRYRIPAQVHIVTKSGRTQLFDPNRRGADGDDGYSEDELLLVLTKKQIADFFIPVRGVEQATAAPGEKRNVSKK